jgi:predicted metal-dependent hydrolase
MKTQKRKTSLQGFKERVDTWATRINVKPTQIRVQRMTRKWASCSTTGWVTFANDLVKEPQAFQDYVIVHELLHLRLPNHGKLFKSLLAAYVPTSKQFECFHNGDEGGSVLKRTGIR